MALDFKQLVSRHFSLRRLQKLRDKSLRNVKDLLNDSRAELEMFLSLERIEEMTYRIEYTRPSAIPTVTAGYQLYTRILKYYPQAQMLIGLGS